MIKLIRYAMVLMVLGGCQTTAGHQARVHDKVNVMVVSFPPGAVIEIDGEYMGRTPSIVALNEYILEHERSAPTYKVFIYPTDNVDHCTQKKALNPYELPEQVSFDLSDCDANSQSANE